MNLNDFLHPILQINVMSHVCPISFSLVQTELLACSELLALSCSKCLGIGSVIRRFFLSPGQGSRVHYWPRVHLLLPQYTKLCCQCPAYGHCLIDLT